ncbi:MAG: hypothetical protein HY435_00735 [Candidatus Liptonbacteria bacterium]|nr:hypothetical protein [Candidatus Liptonbacteria bacterium]
MEKSFSIDGENFTFVKTRMYVPVSVYRGEKSYLRIGTAELIKKDAAIHKQFLQFGFPCPRIIREGTISGYSYYIEESVGDRHFGEIFRSDIAEHGVISGEHFKKFLELGERFINAQLSSMRDAALEKDFWLGIHMDYALYELPALKDMLRVAFNKSWQRISVFPAVLTHGDFNAFNQLEHGVIDTDSKYAFWGPAGYDAVTAMVQPSFFPKHGDYEHLQLYDFSREQMQEYLSMADALFEKHNLQKPSDFVPDFTFCRSVWSVVRMEKVPKLQAWRYKAFEEAVRGYVKD